MTSEAEELVEKTAENTQSDTQQASTGDQDPTGQQPAGLDISLILNQVKEITLSPKSAWEEIAQRNSSLSIDLKSYYLPLAALSAICGVLGMSLFGMTIMGYTIKAKFVPALLQGLGQFGILLLAPFIVGHINSFLSQKFGGKSDHEPNAKLFLYAMLLPLLAGSLQIIPALGVLGLVAGIYSLYLYHTGVGPMTGVPAEKQLFFTISSILGTLVALWILSAIATAILPNPYPTSPGDLMTPEVMEGVSDALKKLGELAPPQ